MAYVEQFLDLVDDRLKNKVFTNNPTNGTITVNGEFSGTLMQLYIFNNWSEFSKYVDPEILFNFQQQYSLRRANLVFDEKTGYQISDKESMFLPKTLVYNKYIIENGEQNNFKLNFIGILLISLIIFIILKIYFVNTSSKKTKFSLFEKFRYIENIGIKQLQ